VSETPASASLHRRAAPVLSAIAWPLAGLALLLGGLEAWVRLGDVPPYVFVPITDVVGTMVDQRSALLSASAVTAKEIFAGFAVAVMVGVPIAVAIEASHWIERHVYPLLLMSQVTPLIAFVPIIVMWFGFGIESKVLVVFLFTFFPIVLDTVAGLRSTDVEKLYLARSIGAGQLATLLRIKLPNALPSMFVGLKIGATLAVIGAVVAEFIGASEGLGTVLLSASGNLDVATMLAGIGYLTFLGFAFYVLVDGVERVALPWHSSRRVHAAKP